jgi:SAM-dependent methyltransferase
MPFSTHRIQVGQQLWTSESGVIAEHDLRTRVLLEACGGHLEGKTIVDLGCLEGGFSVAFARLGALRVVGIEARQLAFQRCEIARKLLSLKNLEFVHGDVKTEIPKLCRFDVVFASGILYHVSDPYSLLELIYRTCREVALLDTHVAGTDAPSHNCSSELITRSFQGRTYVGRIFPEYQLGLSAGQREALVWAAWSNHESFWPLEDELRRMLTDVGFQTIEKVHSEATAYGWHWQVNQENRILLVCRP